MARRRKRMQETGPSSSRAGRIAQQCRLLDEEDVDVSKPIDENVLFELKFHCGGTYDRTKGSYIPSYVMNIENIQSDYFNVRVVQNMVRFVIGIKWPVRIMWVDPYLGRVRNLETSEDILCILGRLRIYKSFIVLVEERIPDGDIEFDKVEYVILSDDDESEVEHIDEPELFYMLEWNDEWNKNPRRKRIKMCARRKRNVKKKKLVKETNLCFGESSNYDHVDTVELGDNVQAVGIPVEEVVENVQEELVENVQEEVVENVQEEVVENVQEELVENVQEEVVENVQEEVVENVQEVVENVHHLEEEIFGELEDFDWANQLEFLFDGSDRNHQESTYVNVNNEFEEAIRPSEPQHSQGEASVEEVNEEQESVEQESEDSNEANDEACDEEESNDESSDEEESEELSEEPSDDFMQEEYGVVHENVDEPDEDRVQNEAVYTGQKDWCSDPDDPDELKSLDSDSDHDEEEIFPEFNEETMMDDPHFKVGMKFIDGDQVRRVIKQYSVLNRKKIRLVKNERWRIRAKCDAPCKWTIFVSRKGKEDTMQVKTLLDKHQNCRPVYESHSISSSWLAKHYLETFRWNQKWPIDAFQQRVRQDFGCQLSRNTLYAARKKAYKLLAGDHQKQYQQLYHYCKTLKNVMPGTTCQLNYTVCPEGRRFRRMYVALGPLKQGFLQGCRNVVCIDSCFLSGPYTGQLMSAVGLDANDGMWPIAYAVVEKENKKAWAWFLKLLVEDLGIEDASSWTFMSDQQKGLLPAIKMVLPDVGHRLCAKHIHNNMKQDHGGQGVRVAFWKCARATTVEYYNIQLEKLKDKKYSAWSWLQRKGPSPDHWTKSHFNTIAKSDILTNNHVEIFNKFILEARSLPIIDMFEKIRLLLQKRIRTNRDIMLKYPGTICPRIVDRLDKQRKLCTKYIAYWNGGSRFEVSGPTVKVVVDLAERTCQCRLWQLSGIPCSHALCALMYKAEDPDDYVHICYHKSTYLKSYENLIECISGPELWLSSAKQPLLAPINTPQPGRPNKKRNKKNDEPTSAQLKKLKQTKQATGKCSKCGTQGHNRRTCKKQASTSGTKKQ